MVDYGRMEEAMLSLCEVYGKDTPSARWMETTKGCMDSEGVTTDQFRQAVFTIMKIKSSKEVFNLPSPADFLDAIGMKPKSIEDTAREQAQEAISAATVMRFRSHVVYGDPITNWVIQNAFGGVAKFCWSIDPTNENREKDVWVTKRFVENYITAYDRGVKMHKPLFNNAIAKQPPERLLMIGNEDACKDNVQLAIDGNKRKGYEMPKPFLNIGSK